MSLLTLFSLQAVYSLIRTTADLERMLLTTEDLIPYKHRSPEAIRYFHLHKECVHTPIVLKRAESGATDPEYEEYIRGTHFSTATINDSSDDNGEIFFLFQRRACMLLVFTPL